MARPGDVYAIGTKKGLGFFQFVKRNKLMGALVRVFPLENPPRTLENWSELIERETNFWIFFPVDAALRRRLIAKVGYRTVPLHARETPLFRAGVPDPSTRKVDNWWLWDGEKSWQIGKLTPEQRRLPIRAAWNDTLLRERLEAGWLPETDSR
ncbi:hypothetical protein BOSP111201_03990 [Bordetella sputigena]|uniref:hypothetical protein n=1 Tax=Bordetella sputigena TaxID=1416810 RepID=UPI0039F101B1